MASSFVNLTDPRLLGAHCSFHSDIQSGAGTKSYQEGATDVSEGLRMFISWETARNSRNGRSKTRPPQMSRCDLISTCCSTRHARNPTGDRVGQQPCTQLSRGTSPHCSTILSFVAKPRRKRRIKKRVILKRMVTLFWHMV